VAWKLAAGLTTLLLLVMTLVKGDFRVSGDAVLEPRIQRAAVAPFRGYIAEAPVRAGDLVREGDLLAVLDDKELVLERARWETGRWPSATRQPCASCRRSSRRRARS
jgi:multidrug efflux pump subunit AcrA (membrane-fusion protein)